MNNLKIALLQLAPAGTADENLKKGIDACRKAKEMGADIALFPEMWSCGYTIPEDVEALQALAVPADGEFVRIFGALAKSLSMAIAVTILEKHCAADGTLLPPRNTVILFDRFGERKLTYAKVHTCDFGDEARLSAGDDFHTAALNTAVGTVQVGAMICYDREFPESARLLMLKGAEVLLVPNACPMEINRLCQLRARAFENMVAIATCNYPKDKPDCNGHSTVFDGVAYSENDPVSRDMKIFEAPENEGIYLAEIDLDFLRQYRKEEVHGNAYRHPKKYHLLIDEEIREPFVRADYKA